MIRATNPREITIEQVTGILYEIEHVTILRGQDFDYHYDANIGYEREACAEVLRDHEFDVDDISSIRFRSHEVTIDVWERDGTGHRIYSRITLHVPVTYDGRGEFYHTTRDVCLP